MSINDYIVCLERELALAKDVMRAAEYYIERLEFAQQRKVVRDMAEAMEWYRRAEAALSTAKESE